MRPIIDRALSGAKRLAYRLNPMNVGERGISLIAVMVIMTSVVLVGVALLTLGTAETDIVQVSVEDAQAFYAAEAGIERTQKVLDQLAKYGTKVDKKGKIKEQGEGIYPDELTFEEVRVGDGHYTVQVTKTGTSDPWDTTYEVVSTGEVNGVTRKIHATRGIDAFSKYVFFAKETKDLTGVIEEPQGQGQGQDDPDIEYTDPDSLMLYSSDVMNGRVHVNEKLRIKGDPFFGGTVSTWKDKIEMSHGSRPVFAKGLKTNADYIPLPKDKKLKNAMFQIANDGGLVMSKIPKGIKDLNGKKIEHRIYDVILGRDGMLGTLSYRVGDRDKLKLGDESSVTDWTDVSIASIGNKVIWFKDKAQIRGTLRGVLTIGSEKEIYISGDILYEGSTPGEGPDPGCTDLLGLIAIKKIKITDAEANRDGCEIHAAIMSVKEGIEVEKVKDYGDRGDLKIYGAVIIKKGKKVVWRCRNCGYLHEGEEAPEVCPACVHPQAHFELLAENW